MQKSNSPLTRETFSQFTSFIEDVYSRKESGSVIGLTQREQIYRVKQLQAYTKNIEIIDLQSYQLEDAVDLDKIIQKKENKIYMILASDRLIEEKKTFLPYFNSLTKDLNLAIIFLFQKNVTYPWNLEKISPYQFLFQNIYKYPQYGEKDKNQFILYLENKFGITVPNKLKEFIKNECGGNFWLIKEAVRYYSKTKGTENIFSHDEMMFRLRVLYEELDNLEKSYLAKRVTNNESLNDSEKTVKEYFRQINFYIPLLEKHIAEKMASETKLDLNTDNRITINSLMVDSFFTKKERLSIRCFLRNRGKIVARTDLAKAIWGKETEYTDWALDQFIRRLRIKLRKIGLDKNIIKTIKNQGFKLTQ